MRNEEVNPLIEHRTSSNEIPNRAAIQQMTSIGISTLVEALDALMIYSAAFPASSAAWNAPTITFNYQEKDSF